MFFLVVRLDVDGRHRILLLINAAQLVVLYHPVSLILVSPHNAAWLTTRIRPLRHWVLFSTPSYVPSPVYYRRSEP